MMFRSSLIARRASACRAWLAPVLVVCGVLSASAQLSINVRPDATTLNTPGTFSTFEIDYRWASTSLDVAGAKIEISLADTYLDNNVVAAVVLGRTAHIATAIYSTSTKKVTFTFVNPLPAGSSGTLTLQTRFRADGMITNGITRPITAEFTATDQPTVSDTSYMTSKGTGVGVTLTKTRSGTNSTTNEFVRYTIAATVPITNLLINPFILVDKLPAGAVFVSASSSGVYDAPTHTVKWPARQLNADAKAVSYTLDLIYPSSNGFAVGSTVVNVASSTNTPLYGATFVKTVTNSYVLVAPTISFDTQAKSNAGFNGQFGDSFTWTVSCRNRGSAVAETLIVEDAFPPAFVPTSFNPGYATFNPTVVWMYYRTKLTPTWVQVATSPVSTTSTTEATAKSVAVTSLGLQPGDVVTDFRWVYTNFNPIATFSATTGPTTTGYLVATDRNGNPVAIDAAITNNATITMTRTGSTPVVRAVTNAVQLALPKAVVDLTKALNPTGQVGYPGSTNTWTLTVANTAAASTNLLNPVVADLLPASLDYVPGSAVRGGTGFTNMTVTATPNYGGTGRTLLRIALLGSQAVGQSATVTIKTVVRSNTAGGTTPNTFSFLSSDTPICTFIDGMVSDTNDLDGDGNTTEKFATVAAVSLTVSKTAAVSSSKAIQGYPDLSFQPLESASYVGGPMAYRLRVQNVGNVALTNIVVVDILPYVGDTGVVVTNDLRDSQWSPVLTGPVSGPAGVTVYYSQSTNPYRPELLADGPPDAINDWSSVPPDDIRTVRALKFAFYDTPLNAADTVELTWPMQIPLTAPTNTYAVNSFGFVATRKDNGESLFPSEPLSVRVKAGPPMPVNIGDYVWNDANTNGVQDVDEVGLNDVRVELYRDGGDGQAGSADDTFVGFVLTGVNTNGAAGFYQFSHQLPGNYFVRVIPTVGYSLSPADAGGDDTLDSDFSSSTGYTAMLVTYSGDRIWTVDSGLYFTGYGTVGNYVWNDRNGDGIQNEGSVDGLNGVLVELYAVDGGSSNLVATETSTYDSFGNPGYYRFDYVAPDNYMLRFVAPSNFTFTTRGAVGTSDVNDSDPDSATGFTEVFAVAIGFSDSSWDAGFRPPTGALSVGNIVWFDTDGDRIYDRLAGEFGINNVPLSLYRDIDDDNVLTEGVDPLYGSTVTATIGGEAGSYRFSGLAAGRYFVTVDSIAFTEGKALAGLISTPGRQDANNDVDHDDNGMWVGNRVVSSGITLAAGLEPAYGTDTGEDDSTDSNLTLDFGFLNATNLVAVGGMLFHDVNNDGLQGAAEPVFSGMIVELWSPGIDGLRGGGDDTNVASMYSDGDGAYLFQDLAPGRYFIIIPTPPVSARSATVIAVDADNGQDGDSNGLQPGSAGAAVYSPVFQLTPHLEPAGAAESGPGGTIDDAFACGDSNVDLTLDFGFADLDPIWTISGEVRNDSDSSGGFSLPDLPIGGVTVQLFTDPNGDGNPIDGIQLASTITQPDGTYVFTDLRNGRYVIVETDPPISTSTADTYGANDNRIAVIVNNANPGGKNFLDTVFGIVTGHLYADTNGNGVQDGGEPNLVDVDVVVQDSKGSIVKTTDAFGNWSATVLPGQVTANVVETDPQFVAAFPNGYLQTDGTDPSMVFAVGSGSVSAGNDGYFNPVGTATLSGTVLRDVGTVGFSGDDLPVPGVVVDLYLDKNGDHLVPFYTVTDGVIGITNGTLLGYAIIDGQVDITGDGVISATDDGLFNGIPVVDGKLDVNRSGSVTSDDDGKVAGELLVRQTATAANGTYFFADLAAGNYVVVEHDPLDATSVDDRAFVTQFPGADTDNQIGVVLLDDDISVGNDFLDADVALYMVSGTVFNDTDASAGFSIPDKPLIGVTVAIYTDVNGDGSLSPSELALGALATGVTSGTGAYSFGGLPNGKYVVVETDPAGFTSVSDIDGNILLNGLNAIAVTVPGANVVGRDFLDVGPASSLGDRVWYDLNGNGVQDGADTGLSGVRVYVDSNGNGSYDADEPSVTTATNGVYAISNLVAGSYTVRVDTNTLPAGLIQISDLNGPLDNTAAVSLIANQNRTDVDFGYQGTSMIGNRVWEDLDKDGIQDSGEPGMTNITVILYRLEDLGGGAFATNLVTSMQTGTNGLYLFRTTPGTYVLRVNILPGYSFSLLNQGEEETDSDFGQDTLYSAPFEVAAGESVLHLDAGMYPKVSPTLSVITSFRAFERDGDVFVAWETAREYDTVGYWVERWVDESWVRINGEEPVWSELTGAPTAYELADVAAIPGGTYTWRIIEFESSGKENIYGPYTVTIDGAAADYDFWSAAINWNGAASGRDDDPDHDGLTNFEEFLAGTNPLNANSVLKITSLKFIGNDIEIRWASVAGRIYAVEHVTKLGGAWLPVKSGIVADGDETRFVLPGADSGFFRVIVHAFCAEARNEELGARD